MFYVIIENEHTTGGWPGQVDALVWWKSEEGYTVTTKES